MSEQDTFWIKLGQRFFGLILLVIGAILLYFTLTSLAELAAFSALFGLLCIVVLVLGVALLISKPPE
jgi:preprotein translocase subunit SecY